LIRAIGHEVTPDEIDQAIGVGLGRHRRCLVRARMHTAQAGGAGEAVNALG
jgi:hypothetical protein